MADDVLESQWSFLLEKCASDPGMKALLERLHGRRDLRGLFPFVSLDTRLRFSRDVESRSSHDIPYLRSRGDGVFEVLRDDGHALGVGSIDEMVGLFLRELSLHVEELPVERASVRPAPPSRAWFEVWASASTSPPRLLLVESGENGVGVLDPREQHRAVFSGTYEAMTVWMNENAFTLVDGRIAKED